MDSNVPEMVHDSSIGDPMVTSPARQVPVISTPALLPNEKPRLVRANTAAVRISTFPVVSVKSALPFTEIEQERTPALASISLKPAESFVVDSGNVELMVNVASSMNAIAAGVGLPILNRQSVPFNCGIFFVPYIEVIMVFSCSNVKSSVPVSFAAQISK